MNAMLKIIIKKKMCEKQTSAYLFNFFLNLQILLINVRLKNYFFLNRTIFEMVLKCIQDKRMIKV